MNSYGSHIKKIFTFTPYTYSMKDYELMLFSFCLVTLLTSVAQVPHNTKLELT